MNTNKKQAEILKFLCLGLSYAFSFGYISLFLSHCGPVMATVGLSILSLVAVLWLELTMWQQRKLGRFSPTRLQKIEVHFWEVILVLLCVNTYFGQTQGLTLLFIHMVVIYMVLVGTGHLLAGNSSCLMPIDLINGLFRIPFWNYFARILSVYETVKDRRNSAENAGEASAAMAIPQKKRAPVWGVIGILFVILLIFSLALENLAAVDVRFAKALASIDRFLTSFSLSWAFLKFILSIPVGAYLFGLFQGGVRMNIDREKEFHERTVAKAKTVRFMPNMLYAVVISIFLLVYLFFFISQGEYMFSAFRGVLPEAFTASQYAVSGFHELINVVLINFFLLSLVRLFGSHENKLLTGLSIALMGESMVFACISASKIILYMTRFGYTSSRTLGLWGTVVVFVGALLAIVHLAYKKKTFMPWLLFSAASYVAMNFICFPFI